eukprot:6561781-Prymnesium_polylepis.1
MQERAPRPHIAKPQRPVVKDPDRYKTLPCANGWYTNSCPYGIACPHCIEELRASADRCKLQSRHVHHRIFWLLHHRRPNDVTNNNL